jgi:hypothetical protein
MASVIRQILERVTATMPLIVPRTEGTLYPFRVWDGSVELDKATMPDLYRAFRVRLGPDRRARTNSNRDTTFLAASLEIQIGYPWHSINPQEANRAGIETICAEDTADIQIALCRKRLAALHTIGIVRSLITEPTRRTTQSQIIPFLLEWGQPNNE